MNGICQLQILPRPCDSYFISKVETERIAVIKPRAISHQCPETYPWPYDVVQVGKHICINNVNGCGRR